MGRADKLLRENCRLVIGRPKTNSAKVVLNVKCPSRLVAQVVIGSGNIGRLGLAEEERLLGLCPWASLSLPLVHRCTHPHPTSYRQAHREANSLFPPPTSLQRQANTNCSTLMSQNKVSLLRAVVLGYLHSCVKVTSAKC